MPENDFLLRVENCPKCGCNDTVTNIAWEQEAKKGKVIGGSDVAAEQLQVPLIDPRKTIGITAPVLLIGVDYCSACGTRYMTWAMVKDAPISMQPPQGSRGLPPFMGQG